MTQGAIMGRGRNKSWYSRSSGYSHFPEYVPVAARRARAMEEIKKHAKKGQKLQPVAIAGRQIALSTWGRGWCTHLEKFHDYFNRLERGRTYARNGSIIHLEINPGVVRAMVSGSRIYNVEIGIKPVAEERWSPIVKKCSGAIASWLDLLAGRFSDGVMAVLAAPASGLFPGHGEVAMSCSCPDGAVMCKHVAAVLYGIGARLDTEPEMLFTLRQVDAADLVSATMQSDELVGNGAPAGHVLAESEDSSFADLFGIEIDMTPAKPRKKAVAIQPVTVAPAPETPAQPAARRRGRPPKSAQSVATPPELPVRRRGRPPKNAAKKVESPVSVKRGPGRPSAEDIKRMYPVVSAAEMLNMGFSYNDISKFLRNGLLKPHARGRYQTTMPLARYRKN